MIDHLTENCSIDQEWGHLYSLKDEGAAEAEEHGHILAPLNDDQKKVIQKGKQYLLLEVDFYKWLPGLLTIEYTRRLVAVSADETLESFGQNLIDKIFSMLNQEEYYS